MNMRHNFPFQNVMHQKNDSHVSRIIILFRQSVQTTMSDQRKHNVGRSAWILFSLELSVTTAQLGTLFTCLKLKSKDHIQLRQLSIVISRITFQFG